MVGLDPTISGKMEKDPRVGPEDDVKEADMLRATSVIPAGAWPAADGRATVPPAHHDRHRRRIRLTADDGSSFLLDLAEANVLRTGAGHARAGGGSHEVKAVPEPLVGGRDAP